MAIVAAVDDSPESSHIISTAHELATGLDEPLTVLHVFTEDEFDDRRDTIPNYTIEQATTDAAASIEGIVMETIGDADVDIRGTVGDPTQEILAAGRDLDARYLVIGGRKRTPVGKALFGSITQSILLEATSPVVAVMAEE